MQTFARLLAGLVAFGGFAVTAARADVVVSHSGATNPITEGWTGVLTSTIDGPVLNDAGTGLDAWAIGKVNGSSDDRFYERFLSPVQTAEAQSVGWRLSSMVLLVNIASSVGQGPAGFAYFLPTGPTTQLMFLAELTAAASGDPIVRIPTTNPNAPIVLNLTGLGSGYHLYEFDYDPVTMLADFVVDGVVRHSGFGGAEIGLPPGPGGRLVFGIPSSLSVGGQGNYNLVQFATPAAVPEPGSLVLLSLVSATGGAVSWRRRRKAA